MVIEGVSDPDLPYLDDGWWESVLAEDESPVEHPSRSGREMQKPSSIVDWEHAVRVYREDAIITMAVTGYNRGGVLVEGDGLTGFIPCSHLVNLPVQMQEQHKEECLSTYIGRTVNVKVIECVPEEDRIVFSERAARAAAGKRREIFTQLQSGQRVAGEVTNVTDFGAFVDLGGVEGLIHISELSWGRVSHPGHIIKVGEQIEVIVLEVSPERCRIALSLKRLTDNPWEKAEEHYPVDSIVPAVITALVPFGAFARLEGGLEGLIHASEIPLPPNLTIRSYLSPGQTVQARVLQVDAPRQRLGLSMKLM